MVLTIKDAVVMVRSQKVSAAEPRVMFSKIS
jgi:hypothetical protein